MSSKKTGRCPRCNASNIMYVFVGRWKHCYACGYDKKMQSLDDYLTSLHKRDKIAPEYMVKAVGNYKKSLKEI